MTQPYIGRAAEAAARAKHNRIHKVKKTAKRRPAKKAPTKATKAIEEALGAFKSVPINQKSLVTEKGRKLYEDDILEAQEAFNKAKKLRPDLNFPSPNLIPQPKEWTEYGPLGGQDEEAIAREVLGMEMKFPEEPVAAQEEPSEASEPALAQAAPEPPVKASQATPKTIFDMSAKELSESGFPLHHKSPEHEPTRSQLASCILNLIDALNFLHREGHLRKLSEKDILILKQRIKTGRQLIEKL